MSDTDLKIFVSSSFKFETVLMGIKIPLSILIIPAFHSRITGVVRSGDVVLLNQVVLRHRLRVSGGVI